MERTEFLILFLLLAFGFGVFGMNCTEVSVPFVVSTLPANGDEELKLATVIVINFSEPMDQASVESAFSIPGVTGSFSWNEDGDRMTFTPSILLGEDEGYQVTIWDTAQDRSGAPLENPYQFGFRSVNLWTRIYSPASSYCNGAGITLDQDSNVYLTGNDTGDIWVSKYNRDGDTLWTKTYDGPSGGSDTGEDIAVDQSGNVYVTGWEELIGGTNDLWVRKYDTDGNEEWTRTQNGTSGEYDKGRGITVDERGDIYVVGTDHTIDEGRNIWIRKYDPDGTGQWTRTYNDPLDGTDEGYDIAVDENGNIYVIGNEYVPGESLNIWIRKYDEDRIEQWTRGYGLGLDVYDGGRGITVDTGGNVYVCGYVTQGTYGGDYDIWVRKYDPDGVVLWTKTHAGPYLFRDSAEDIAVDASGNVYVVGWEYVGDFDADIWVRKYDSDGNTLWTFTHSGPPHSWDNGYGIAVDMNGNVFVIGSYDSRGGGTSAIWIRKFDTDGNWAE